MTTEQLLNGSTTPTIVDSEGIQQKSGQVEILKKDTFCPKKRVKKFKKKSTLVERSSSKFFEGKFKTVNEKKVIIEDLDRFLFYRNRVGKIENLKWVKMIKFCHNNIKNINIKRAILSIAGGEKIFSRYKTN